MQFPCPGPRSETPPSRRACSARVGTPSVRSAGIPYSNTRSVLVRATPRRVEPDSEAIPGLSWGQSSEARLAAALPSFSFRWRARACLSLVVPSATRCGDVSRPGTGWQPVLRCRSPRRTGSLACPSQTQPNMSLPNGPYRHLYSKRRQQFASQFEDPARLELIHDGGPGPPGPTEVWTSAATPR